MCSVAQRCICVNMAEEHSPPAGVTKRVLVDRIVNPAARLHDAQASPLRLGHDSIYGYRSHELLWERHVPASCKAAAKDSTTGNEGHKKKTRRDDTFQKNKKAQKRTLLPCVPQLLKEGVCAHGMHSYRYSNCRSRYLSE